MLLNQVGYTLVWTLRSITPYYCKETLRGHSLITSISITSIEKGGKKERNKKTTVIDVGVGRVSVG